jgi:hypothetical protein
MRRLKWALAAGWLGVHALLWTVLPPTPIVRLPCALPPWRTAGSPYRQPGWECFEDRKTRSDFAFVAGGRRIVTRETASLSIFDMHSRQSQPAWRFDAPAANFHTLMVSPNGDRTVVLNSQGPAYAVDLNKGDATMIDEPARLLAAAFSADGKQCVYLADGPVFRWALYSQDIATGRTASHRLSNQPETLAVSPDGRTAAVGVADNFQGSRDQESWGGMEFVGLAANGTSHLDKVCRLGQWLGCGISPDGRTLVGSFSNYLPFPAQRANFRPGPYVATWDVPSGRRRATLDHAWSRGWCADGRLVIRTEDGDCFFADATLARQTSLPFPLAESDELFVDEAGRHLLVKHPWKPNVVIEFIRTRLKLDWKDPGAYWECFDLTGRRETAVPGWGDGCSVSPNGEYLAVRSPDGNAIDVYTLPPSTPGGIVLGLMIVEVAFFIAWTAWRRRVSRHTTVRV